ncbi:MAG: helix-turn-helix domain-containing protein [Zoogloeaceae bacterium]|nr:helix-turn-helix domain-containing protein [Zoogloeaceae bacterium]
MAKRSKLTGVTPLVTFGQVVRATRMDKGVSQEALADLAGIDRSYMGGIERGEHNLSLFNIHRIAAALDVSIAELMHRANL